jgi:coenzyme PQQ biosynthesis protein PqqD
MITSAFVPKLAKKARLRFDRHEEQHVLLYPERGLVLSKTAAAIAERCDGTRSVDAIIGELSALYAAPRPDVERDVLSFLEDLAGRGLLEPP